MRRNDAQPVIIALAFIGLLAFIFFVTMRRLSTPDDFLKIWAAVGPVVGVVTGLIPTYFFRAMANDATSRAEQHAENAGAARGKLEGLSIPLPDLVKTPDQPQEHADPSAAAAPLQRTDHQA